LIVRPVKHLWYDTFDEKVFFHIPPLGNCNRVTTSTRTMVLRPFLLTLFFRCALLLVKISVFLYSRKDIQ
jgi:hypothetical protein